LQDFCKPRAEYLAVKPSRLTMYLRDGLHTSVPYGQDARNELTAQSLVAPVRHDLRGQAGVRSRAPATLDDVNANLQLWWAA
jgi:hypothetical protein